MSLHTGFYHSVYFWMQEGADAQELAQGCIRHLSAIPGVAQLAMGMPAGTPRDVVDNSYGVALLIEFRDAQAHDIYQDHPDHRRFIAQCSLLWSRVQIYDVLPLVR